MATSPGARDQNASRPAIAGQRQAAAFDAFAGRALQGNQAEAGHQLPWVLEAPGVADLDGEGDRDNQGDAAQRLIGRRDRRHRPIRRAFLAVTLETRKAFRSGAHRIDEILKDDLPGRMFELLRRQPTKISCAPCAPSRESPAMSQKKRLRLLALLAQILARGLPRPHEIAHRLVRGVGDPYPRQLPARNRRAKATASRRFVFTRSPGGVGTQYGATTSRTWPIAEIWRCKP